MDLDADDRGDVQVNTKKVVMTFMGAVYGGPGMAFLWQGEIFGAFWGIGFGLLCLWMAEN